jgi:hypothetical protein
MLVGTETGGRVVTLSGQEGSLLAEGQLTKPSPPPSSFLVEIRWGRRKVRPYHKVSISGWKKEAKSCLWNLEKVIPMIRCENGAS